MKSLSAKLALAFVLVAFSTAALVALFFRITNSERLSQLITDQQRSSMQQILSNYYQKNGSWDGVYERWQEIRGESMMSVNGEDGQPGQGMMGQGAGQGNSHERRIMFGLADADGRVVISMDQQTPIGTVLTRKILRDGTPVTVNGVTVGTILAVKQLSVYSPEETLFLQRTNRALLMAVIGSVLAALLVGVLLARTLTHPLKALTRAAQGIARGQLQQEVSIDSQDEIGQLALAFNGMSQEVARVQMQRKQMTADIAHDLRTPLTVIGGYVESMRDGVLQPTPERFTLIYAEIERLQHLVGDLRMLSQVDAGELPLHPQRIEPQALLARAAAVFQHQAEQNEITLKVMAPENLPEVNVDEARMMQVLDNLLSNAFRYTPRGGSVTLSAHAQQGKVELVVEDTGSGIAPEELSAIFNRFHRADKSRHTEMGESGLGLAIVKALVEAHGGRVWAESTLDEGTAIHIQLRAA